MKSELEIVKRQKLGRLSDLVYDQILLCVWVVVRLTADTL